MLLPKTVPCPVGGIGGTLLQLLASKYHTIFSHFVGLLHSFTQGNSLLKRLQLYWWITMRWWDVLWWQEDRSRTWLCMAPQCGVRGSCEHLQPPDVVADLLSYISPTSVSPSPLLSFCPPFCRMSNFDTVRQEVNCFIIISQLLISLQTPPHREIFA